jgi:hypothetical protein
VTVKKFDNIYDVVAYCKTYYSGDDYIFRGQRKRWRLQSSLFRIIDMQKRERVLFETDRFCQWIEANPLLKPFHNSLDARFAIAQHYSDQFGLATDLIDFSRDAGIAAYFATTSKEIRSGDEGIIYVATISDFEEICRIYRERERTPYPEAFYIPEFVHPGGFWRLESQKGFFMRDDHGFVSQPVHGEEAIEAKLIFKQTEGKTITDYMPEINRRSIWPPRNELEWEIERYNDIILRSRPLPRWLIENTTSIYFGRNTDFQEFEKEMELLDWDKEENKWTIMDQTPYVQYTKVSCILEGEKLLTNEEIQANADEVVLEFKSEYADASRNFPQHLQVIKTLRRYAVQRTGSIVPIRLLLAPEIKSKLGEQIGSLLQLLKDKVTELLRMTLMYPYTEAQIARSAQNMFSFALHTQNSPAGDRGRVGMSKAFNDDSIMELELEDKSNIVMRGFVPSSYLDDIESMTRVRNYFNTKYPEIQLERNYALLLNNIVVNIRKLISLDELVEMWASIMLPWQLLFRSVGRIINPYYLISMGHP